MGEDIARVFAAILTICDRQGLIGREMFAIDGVKLPSNAAKRRSGTRADFERQAAKLETAANTMLADHREEDARPVEPDLAARKPNASRCLRNSEQTKTRRGITGALTAASARRIACVALR